MAWVGATVTLGVRTPEMTANELASWAARNCPRAIKRSSPLGKHEQPVGLVKDRTDEHGMPMAATGIVPHMTLLYHGHELSDAVRAVCAKWKITELNYAGVSKRLYPVQNEYFNGLTLTVECDAIQTDYPQFRADMEAATGQISEQHEHTVPPGQTPHKNGFHPHVTLAEWDNKEAMAADMAAMSQRESMMLVGQAVAIGPFRLE